MSATATAPAPMSIIDHREHDRQIWEEELADFVPQRVFDAHCHLFIRKHLPTESPHAMAHTDVDFQALRDWSQSIYPGRELGFLILGTPVPGIDEEGHNRWIADEIAGQPLVRFNRLVSPRCKLADIERDVTTNKQIIGLKPYRLYSVTGDPNNCRIHEFLPHEQLELANQHGLWITMHLSRSDGCADTANLDDLHEYTTKRYPKIKWILAHCARSFTYYAIRNAVDRLRDMPNIWYDVSAVTDMRPHLTLFQKEDLKRIFYGSDGVTATGFHGSYVCLGRAWQTFDVNRLDLKMAHTKNRPVLCIYEQLLAMKHAAEIAGLTRSQIEDLFWNNAVRALGVQAAAPARR